MGNIDSIPVVSQVKSLVQVIGGDAEGAKKTQEKFSREAPVYSQVNSFVQTVQGNYDEARKIQEDFAGNAVEVAKGIPAVGFGMSAYYAIDGDTDKAKALALQTTKGVAVASAGAAGMLCGPAAPACSAGLTVAASTGWDAAEGGIRGEKVGSIKAWDNLVHGKSSIGKGFDLIGGTALQAAGAALGARGGAKFGGGRFTGGRVSGGRFTGGRVSGGRFGGPKSSGFKPKYVKGKSQGTPFRGGPKSQGHSSSRCIVKRYATDGYLFERNLPDVPDDLSFMLPGSVSELSFNESLNGTSIIDNVLGIFFVLKLMSIGHVKSKPYYNEICTGVYPNLMIEECTTMLFNALTKYEDDTPADDEDYKDISIANHTLFTDLLDGVEFEMMSLSKNTVMGHILEAAACNILDSETMCVTLEKKLKRGLSKIDTFIQIASTKIRRKRCLRRTNNSYAKFIQSFKNRHGSGPLEQQLAKVSKNGDRLTQLNVSKLNQAFKNGRVEYMGQKPGGAQSFRTLDKMPLRDVSMEKGIKSVEQKFMRPEVYADGKTGKIFHYEKSWERKK